MTKSEVSSNAEKAWEKFAEKSIDQFIPAPIAGGMKFSFNSGRRSRDAEVAQLREQLAAAEAVIEKVRDAWNDDTGWVEFGESVGAILPVAPSEVLAEHDREVAARTLEDAAQVVDDMTFAADYLRDSIARWLRERAHVERAAAIRKGDTNA